MAETHGSQTYVGRTTSITVADSVLESILQLLLRQLVVGLLVISSICVAGQDRIRLG